jgi:signal transduction histidine kinase
MEKIIHRYILRKEFLKRAVRNPLDASISISSSYFVFSFIGLYVSEFLIQQHLGGEVAILSDHISADLIFLLFSTSFIFGLSYYALINLNSAYLRVEDEKRIRMEAIKSVDREIGELTRKISHDLKAPIRTMQGFSQAVSDDYADQLDPAALDYLKRIRIAAERMDNLINELVVYARLSSKSPVFESVDCVNYMIKQLIPQIRPELPNEITIETSGAIPMVYADKFLLSHIFKEILINAATYIKPETHPKITITGQINQENTIIRIQDNGIGVDSAQQENIFNIFTRIHGIEQYPGLGLGLAIAKRCMHIMDGDIVLESDGISGSTIILTFAKPTQKYN